MNHKYFLYVKNIQVEVTKEVYNAYWQEVEREKYLSRLIRKHWVYLDHYFEGYHQNNLEYELVSNIERLNAERNNEVIDDLKKAIKELDAEEQLIVYLIYYEEYNQTEIASILNTSQQNISRKHRNILKKLKKLMNI